MVSASGGLSLEVCLQKSTRIHCCARADVASRCEFGVVLQASGYIGIRGCKVVDGRRVGDWEVKWDQVWLGASKNMGVDG